jgi:hypothetical protein
MLLLVLVVVKRRGEELVERPTPLRAGMQHQVVAEHVLG